MSAPETKLDTRFSDADAVATSWNDTRQALEAAELFWITTVRRDGRPHTTPLVAVWLGACGGPLSCTLSAMQEAHGGRLFDHVGIRVRDVEASRAFYAAVLEPLGLRITASGDGWFSADELFVSSDGTQPTGSI